MQKTVPYKNNDDLPEPVKKHLPKHAQDIYREAFNSAWHQYKDPENRTDSGDTREEVAHKVAWNAVKHKYEKGPDENWHPKK